MGDSSRYLGMPDRHFGFYSAVVANAEPAMKEAVLKNRGCIVSACRGNGLAETIEKFRGKSEAEA